MQKTGEVVKEMEKHIQASTNITYNPIDQTIMKRSNKNLREMLIEQKKDKKKIYVL